MFGSIPIVDDRRRKTSLIPFGGQSAKDDPDLPIAIALLADRIDASPSRFLDLVVVALVASGAMAGLVALAIINSVFPRWVVFPGACMVLAIAWMVLVQVKRRRNVGIVVHALLGVGRCPSCGYHLSAAPVGEDGCCVCPECSAAWQRERVGQALVPRLGAAYSAGLVGAHTPLHMWARAWMRYPRVWDDRGHSVPLVQPGMLRLERAAAAAGATSKIQEATRPTKFAWSVLILVVAGFFAASQAAGYRASGLAHFSVEIVLWICGAALLFGGWAWRLWTGRLSATVKPTLEVLKALTLCPSCGLDLRTHAADSDGVTVCSRCGSAWQFPARRVRTM